MTATTLAPGLHDGVPEDVYHALPGLSSTGARALLDSPARYAWHREHPPTSTAFDVGRAAHAKILGVGAGVVLIPDEHLTPSGAVSQKRATLDWLDEQRAAGLVPIAPDEAERIDAMAEAVLAHPAARALLEHPAHRVEVTAIATDPATGVPCRARVDVLAAGVVGDLKTTAGSAGPDGFGREAARHGYPVQQAHYADVLEWVTGYRPEFRFIVVEKQPPHLVAVHRFDLVTQLVARDLAARARQLYAECTASGAWPGYGDDVLTPRMPAWWLLQTDDEEIEL